MVEQKDRKHSRSQVKKGSNTFNYIAAVIVILFVASFYFYVQKSPSTSTTGHVANPAAVEKTPLADQLITQPPDHVGGTAKEQADVNALQPEKSLLLSETDSSVGTPMNPGITGAKTANELEAEQALPAVTDVLDLNTQQIYVQNNHQQLIDQINAFYAHLDEQPYMQDFNLKESSKMHFSKLLQKLIDNPPVLIGETNDLFTLLQNTAHFFRIIGKDNINILKMILEKENDSFEMILKNFYQLTYEPKYLVKEYSLTLHPQTLTDYAGFFLNTIGGRLYLFRRDSTSRLIVTYYAVISIDRANRAGNGGHGIDLRPSIRSLVEEIENGGKRLQLRDEYLDTLYDLQEKYNQ